MLACWRRLQSGSDVRAIAEPFDGDARLVEGQRENSIAKLADQRGSQGNRGMTAEGNLGFRRKIADPPVVPIGCGKGGLRESDPRRDALHFDGIRQNIADQDSQAGLPPGIAIRKGRNLLRTFICLRLMRCNADAANAIFGAIWEMTKSMS